MTAPDPLRTLAPSEYREVMEQGWLSEIVLVNESPDEATLGDVSIYRSAGEACSSLEHWWVQNREGFVFTATGVRLTLAVDARNKVIVTGQQEVPNGPDLVLVWLRGLANVVLDGRRRRARKGKATLTRSEEQGLLPTSVEGLIAYVGFDV